MPEQEILVRRTDQLEQDQLTRARCARFIGQVSLKEEILREPPAFGSLLEAIKEAADGNELALSNVSANAHTATVEAIYKTGHVTRIKTEFRADGSRVQHGQSMLDVHANALLFAAATPELRQRVHAETLNGHRIVDLNRAGLLKDYWLFVPSFYPDDMSEEATEAAGFFTDTKTGIFQATTEINGLCVTESAFVAGAASTDSSRHDIAAGRSLYEHFGQEAPLTTTGFIENPLLIHKSLMPNGVTDIVKLFDEQIGDSFFGQRTAVQDYIKYLDLCHERELRLNATTANIVAELLASKDQLQRPTDAIRMLHRLVKKHVIREAVRDENIDTSVFGGMADFSLRQAREFYKAGDMEKAGQAIGEAEQVAKVGMCGIGDSCGLENIKLLSGETDKLKKLLKAEAGDTILKDTKRACKCGRKSIVYAFNKLKVNKLCQGCGVFESKTSVAA